jgi:hypothetical protein
LEPIEKQSCDQLSCSFLEIKRWQRKQKGHLKSPSLDKILSEVVTVGTRLGALNRGLEQQVDGMRDSSLKLLGEGAQRILDTQLLAAREAGAFGALDRVVVSEALSAEYQAFTQSLREMAQLEGSMQKVAESGQQLIHRLADGRKDR